MLFSVITLEQQRAVIARQERRLEAKRVAIPDACLSEAQ
jgi:hypothetical protein